MKLNISVAPETIFHLGQVAITNSVLTSMLVMTGLVILAFAVKSKKSIAQSKLLLLMDMATETIYKFLKQIAGERINLIFPLLFTFFLFIIISNWVGLLPLVGSLGIWEETAHGEVLVPLFRGPNADLNTTLALALISVGTTQYLSIKALGLKGYLSRFINLANPIKFFVGILEIISEISKILSFSFRLFGNIFAGEVLLAVMIFLIPLILPVPFLFLEIFVGFIQALVFTMLSTIFIVVATNEHH